ncbi:MAG TPA: nicotinate-nucleotide adenylyltransferase [Actinomycetota bacterium]|nr:nicotinate-nucleotide adenylyltransferase [Actinomycetota bacterium]
MGIAPEPQLHRIGVFGGTFDPIHVGHLIAARAAQAAYGLDRIVFVTAGSPWQKADYSDPEDRFMMSVLAAASDPCFTASRVELDRRGPTYSIETLELLRSWHGPGVDLFFIGGVDAIANIATWHRALEVGEVASVIAVARSGHLFDEVPELPGGPRIFALPVDPVDVSSTEIRRRVAAGESIDGMVPPGVAGYIEARGLYRDPAGGGPAR